MAKTPKAKIPETKGMENPIIWEVIRHYNQWTEDNDKRRTRPNGWDAITDAYWGKLPSNWPYSSRVVDPRIRTSLIEKKARLLNQKLRGRLVPREGSDVIKAKINNALLDFQWDNANNGGTMLSKWGSMDQDTRMYGSDFGMVKWRYEKDEKGNVLFDGNEFTPLDVRNCGFDGADHIRSSNWFQDREWMTIESMQRQNDQSDVDKPMFPGLDTLIHKVTNNPNNKRENAYPNRILQVKGLQDRVGYDKSYPVIEVVTEYRKDRWITFAPLYKVILRDIPNPYKHGKIPVVQLRYYKVTGDGWGESEVEPVLPWWKAIQAIVCGYIDNMNIHNRPPLKILDGKVRIETIVFGAEAQWLMDQPDAITEFEGSNAAMQYFNTAYPSAVSAFNAAMGDLSQGVSSIDPLSKSDPTATEIRNTAKQQNTRDQDNQTQLAEALEDMMSMWVANNQQFLFADPDKQQYVMRVVGSDLYNYFKRAGLDAMEHTPESMQAIADVVHQQNGDMSDSDLQTVMSAGETPKFPVFDNPSEKNPSKLRFKPKMSMNDMGDGAEVIIVPEDMEGIYDFVPDVKSMSSGADEVLQQARDNALDRLTKNPAVLQLLQSQGISIDLKELLVADLEGAGLQDAERFFTTNQQQGIDPTQATGQGVMPGQNQPIAGDPAGLIASLTGGQPNPMAQSTGGGIQPQVPNSLQ